MQITSDDQEEHISVGNETVKWNTGSFPQIIWLALTMITVAWFRDATHSFMSVLIVSKYKLVKRIKRVVWEVERRK